MPIIDPSSRPRSRLRAGWVAKVVPPLWQYFSRRGKTDSELGDLDDAIAKINVAYHFGPAPPS